MNERDYILATNCARLQIARETLREVLVTDEDGYGLDRGMWQMAMTDLARLIDMAFAAMDMDDK